jgi:hypothetical protein
MSGHEVHADENLLRRANVDHTMTELALRLPKLA